MITRRTFAGLAAGSLFAPGLAAAQTMRRTVDANTAMPDAGRRPWAEQVPQLRVGLLGGENEADRLGRFGAYRELLERTEAGARHQDRPACAPLGAELGLHEAPEEQLLGETGEPADHHDRERELAQRHADKGPPDDLRCPHRTQTQQVGERLQGLAERQRSDDHGQKGSARDTRTHQREAESRRW